jgi:hypothetical protein
MLTTPTWDDSHIWLAIAFGTGLLVIPVYIYLYIHTVIYAIL